MTATYQELPVTDNIHLWNEFTAFNCRRIARVNWKSTLIFLLSCSGLFFQPTNDLIVSPSLSVLLWGGEVIGNKPQFSYQIRVSFNEIHLFFRWLWGQFVYSSSHLLPLLSGLPLQKTYPTLSSSRHGPWLSEYFFNPPTCTNSLFLGSCFISILLLFCSVQTADKKKNNTTPTATTI